MTWFWLALAGCGALGFCLGGLACWGRGARYDDGYDDGWRDSAEHTAAVITGLRDALADASRTLLELPGPPPPTNLPAVTTAPSSAPVTAQGDGQIGGPGPWVTFRMLPSRPGDLIPMPAYEAEPEPDYAFEPWSCLDELGERTPAEWLAAEVAELIAATDPLYLELCGGEQ
jgi:hypothetical protein